MLWVIKIKVLRKIFELKKMKSQEAGENYISRRFLFVRLSK
jgi:hypothetical protein